MNRRTLLRSLAGAATGAGVTLAGCSGTREKPSPGVDSAGTNTVRMVTAGGSYYFDPIGLFVETGESVTWELQSGVHSSTAYDEEVDYATVTRIPNGASSWDSGVLTDQGATFEHAFETTGTYDYFCIPHKSLGMVGRIVVGEPSGSAEGGMPPDGRVPTSNRIVESSVVTYDEFLNDSNRVLGPRWGPR